jgi:hypothetical protein
MTSCRIEVPRVLSMLLLLFGRQVEPVLVKSLASMRPTVRCRQNAALQIIPRCFAKDLFTATGRLFGLWAALAEPVAPGDRSEFSRCALVLRRGATCSNSLWACWTTPFEKPEVAMKMPFPAFRS